MKKKLGTEAYEKALEKQSPGKQAPARRRSLKAAGLKPLGTYIDPQEHFQIKQLALRLSQERGRAVLMADLVAEALRDLLKKYGRAKPARGIAR